VTEICARNYRVTKRSKIGPCPLIAHNRRKIRLEYKQLYFKVVCDLQLEGMKGYEHEVAPLPSPKTAFDVQVPTGKLI